MTSLHSAMNPKARKTNRALTRNQGATHASSGSANLDLFFLAGASRGKDITDTFVKALKEDSELAGRVALWMRDARSGAGEREQFRNFLRLTADNDAAHTARLLSKAPELGRWDDVLSVIGTDAEGYALKLIAKGLKDEDGLCAKWMPRKGAEANKIRKFLKLSPKAYRKTLVRLSKTVEQQMCAKNWDEINFSHVPSVAAARYQKAFWKHLPEKYEEYVKELQKPKAQRNKNVKINAGAVYPYDVLRSAFRGNSGAAQAQWEALPNYMKDSEERILPVIDVSASMLRWNYYGDGGSASASPMEIAVSLGLYVAERNVGVFKDTLMTFTNNPSLYLVSGDLKSRYEQVTRHVGYNTDFQKMLQVTLRNAVKNNVPQDEMPTKLLVISDMEFDGSYLDGLSLTAAEAAREEYERAGYKMPQLVFWNVNGREGNSPVTQHESGTALVSGFSPSIMLSLLGEDLSPNQVMLDTVMKDRYNY